MFGIKKAKSVSMSFIQPSKFSRISFHISCQNSVGFFHHGFHPISTRVFISVTGSFFSANACGKTFRKDFRQDFVLRTLDSLQNPPDMLWFFGEFGAHLYFMSRFCEWKMDFEMSNCQQRLDYTIFFNKIMKIF